MLRTRAITLALWAAFTVVTVPAGGQEKQAPPKAPETGEVRKVIQLRYANAEAVKYLLSPWGTAILASNPMKMLTIVGNPAAVEAIEEAVKKLDVPPPAATDVELTAYFLLATRQTSEEGALPAALKEVVIELKKVLNYQGFTLLNTAVIRTQDDQRGDVSGAAGGPPLPAEFQLGFSQLNVVSGEGSPTIHLRDLNFEIWNREVDLEKKSPGETKGAGERINLARIHTNLDIPVGQKVVVGKTSFGLPDNALVLVLTAKVL